MDSDASIADLLVELAEAQAENRKWRDVAARLDAETPDELDTAVSTLGSCIEIAEFGYWGLYALEGVFDALEVKPGECASGEGGVIERIEKWKRSGG